MYTIIVNPASKSGRGRKIWEQLEPVLISKRIEYRVIFSKYTGYISRYVRDFVAGAATEVSEAPIRLIILGGDGTLNEALQGLFASGCSDKVELGYIPAGSSNDLARALRLPADPQAILETILSGRKHRWLDVGVTAYWDHKQSDARISGAGSKAAERYFAVSSGIGFDAAVCAGVPTSRFKKILNKIGLGKLIYLAVALRKIITAGKNACDIYLDDGEPIHLRRFLFVAAMIHRYEGGGFKFCPDADYSDGRFDICVVGALPKAVILLALPLAFAGKHLCIPGIKVYRAAHIRIETSAPLWVHTDGEVPYHSRSITMTCLRQKLHLLV